MSTNGFETVALGKGEVRVYDFGDAKLHAYQTNDPIDDEVIVVEKDGKGFVIEYPCFFDNIEELEDYVRGLGIEVEGVVAAYHIAGASFLPDVPALMTREAEAYGRAGGGKDLIDGFSATFGDAFDASAPQVVRHIEGDVLSLAGVEMRVVRNDEAFDLLIPELNAAYLHMLGHDCHSIVAGPALADAQIARLEGLLDDGTELFLTSHYVPEGRDDVRAKIAYLRDVKRLAAASSSADAFKKAVAERYPAYTGGNYLDMTAGFFFA